MTTIVTRTGKGSPLTHVEVDTNFTNLNTAKLENLAAAAGAGTAAAPSISFAADPSTGVFSPGAYQLAVATNGTGRLFVDASGKVTSSSAWTSTAAGQLLVSNTTNLSSNQTTEYANIELRREGVSGVYNEVSAWLSVYQYSTDGNANSALAVSTSPAGSGSRVKVIDIRHTDISFFTGAQGGSTTTERLRITAAGNVGIGTSSPSQLLHVQKDQAAATFARIDNQSSSSSAYAGVQLGAYGNTWGLAIGSSAANSNSLAFVLDVGGTNSEKLRIDSSGRLLVGTGTDSGGALFQVNGDRIRVGTAKTPATSGATGTTGEIAWDANYIYVCTATNTWKRSAIATW